MKTVQPIRDIAMIAAMKDVLMKQHYRNYFLFVLGINTGLRISDLLALRVGDVRGSCFLFLKSILLAAGMYHYADSKIFLFYKSYRYCLIRCQNKESSTFYYYDQRSIIINEQEKSDIEAIYKEKTLLYPLAVY